MFKKNYLLFLILILALLIRVIGLVPGFNTHHPDEGMSYTSVVRMLLNNNLNPGRFDYPSGVPLIHYLIYKGFILPFVLLKSNPFYLIEASFQGGHFYKLFQAQIFGFFYVNALFWSRYITAILGILSVIATYFLGSKLFNKRVGIFASLFLTFNYRHVIASHLALSDIPNGLFVVLALLSCVFLLGKNSRRNYILAGLFTGLSLSMKYQTFPLLNLLAVHLYWVLKAKKEKRILGFFNKNLLLSIFLIVGVFVSMNIYFFLNFKEALYQVGLVAHKYGTGAYKFNFYPIYYLYYWGIGKFVSIIILFGVIVGLIKYRFKTFFLLIYVFPFFFVFLYLMIGGSYVRNFTTVMPLLMIFAGLFFSFLFTLFQKVVGKKCAFLLIIALLILVNFEPAKNSFLLDMSYLKPWNKVVLKEWAEKNLPYGVSVANGNVGLPMDSDLLRKKSVKLIVWNQNDANSITELQDENYDFLVLNVFWNQGLLYWWFDVPTGELISYKEIPYKLLDNSYQGIALHEFLKYTVYEIYKPWQGVEFNYLVVKIPPRLTDFGRNIYFSDFNQSPDGWVVRGVSKEDTGATLTWDKNEGKTKKGSLSFSGILSWNYSTRFVSRPIKIQPGKTYTAIGFIKTSKKLAKNDRDGFIRIDFYKDKGEKNIENGGIVKAVSSRNYGSYDWIEKQVIAKAPLDAQFLTISFQRSFRFREKNSYTVWLDDVSLFESDQKIPEKFPDVPYIFPSIPDNVLYPNSIL